MTPDAIIRRSRVRGVCAARGHTWSVIGAPLGSTCCRTCGRWEADPLWLPFMDEDLTSERAAAA